MWRLLGVPNGVPRYPPCDGGGVNGCLITTLWGRPTSDTTHHRAADCESVVPLQVVVTSLVGSGKIVARWACCLRRLAARLRAGVQETVACARRKFDIA